MPQLCGIILLKQLVTLGKYSVQSTQYS